MKCHFDKGTSFSRIMHSFYLCQSGLPPFTDFIMGLTCLWRRLGFIYILEVTVLGNILTSPLEKKRKNSINLLHKL